MSHETLHSKAMRALAMARGTQAQMSARLCRVDLSLALEMQAWLASSVAAPVPERFKAGRAAPCFALLTIAARKPLVFWAAMIAIPLLPVLLALHWI